MLLGILKIDNVFKLKIAVITFKIINMNEKVPIQYSLPISLLPHHPVIPTIPDLLVTTILLDQR
jgi:hypothetical protein